jgi:hypothetical protein
MVLEAASSNLAVTSAAILSRFNAGYALQGTRELTESVLFRAILVQ